MEPYSREDNDPNETAYATKENLQCQEWVITCWIIGQKGLIDTCPPTSQAIAKSTPQQLEW